MKNYPNRNVKNVKSPKNERQYINAYKELNPKANKKDNLDVAAVVSASGERGHALVNQKYNRGHDTNYHRGKAFISNKELRKNMRSK